MHKLRLRSRSTAASPSSDGTGARSLEGGERAPANGRTSTSTATSGRSSSDVKGKGKEKSSNGVNGLKASFRSIGSDRKNTTKNSNMNPSTSNAGLGVNYEPPAANSRPQLSLPSGNDFRTSLILPELTRRFTLMRGKDGSLVPLDKMQAHLRIQRENGRLTENEEEMVLRQYRLQSIYEAAQPHDMDSSYASPSINGLVALPEETGSLYSSRANSRLNVYTPEPMTPSLSSPALGAPYSPYATSSSNNSHSMLPSPQLMAASASSASSATSTPTPVSTVGFASSSAAEFYAARDAVMRGNGLFGGGGLEREIHTKMNSSANLSQQSENSTTSPNGTPGTPGKRYRSKRYTTTGSANKALSDSESQHSASNDGHSLDIGTSTKSFNNFVSAIPPVPRIVRQQEEEYDPFRPRDDDDVHEVHGYNQASGYGSRRYGAKEDHEGEDGRHKAVVPPHLDVPMSKKQIHRISRALQNIEMELSKTYDFVGGKEDNHIAEGNSQDEQEEIGAHQHSNSHSQDEFDYTPSDEEGGYNSSYDFSRNIRNNFRHDDAEERTFHSSISVGEESNSSEYHHQHSSRAPFVYDDTDEIDPPLNRLPSQYELDSRAQSRMGGEDVLGGQDEQGQEGQGQHPVIHLDRDPQDGAQRYQNHHDDEGESQYRDRLSSSTRQSNSTAIPDEGRSPRSATTSTSTLDVIIDGDEAQTHQQSYGSSLHPQYNGISNARLSASSNISKALSSPGLPYLQATPPVRSYEFPDHSCAIISSGSANEVSSTNSSESSGSAAMQPSTSNRTLSSVATSHSLSHAPASGLSTSMARLPSNTSISGSNGGSILPRHLQSSQQGEFSPAHSRDNSASSSIAYNPPLSPPPQCRLPPLPSSASGHSLASLGQVSVHSQMPSVDSVTLMSPSTSLQGANAMKVEEDEKEAAQEELKVQQEESIAFPTYPRGEAYSDSPHVAGGEQNREEERNRHDSMQSSEGSESNPHRYSNTSTGSSWRGGPGGHVRSLSTSTVDFDLPPTSPYKTTHRMTNIEEDIDEDDMHTSERQEEEREKAMEYLKLHAPGLDMHDLRAIHERLVESALQQHDIEPNEPSENREVRQEQPEEQVPPATAFTSELFASESVPIVRQEEGRDANLSATTDLEGAKLGSPFMEQNGFVDQQDERVQNGDTLPTVLEEDSNVSQGRDIAAHPLTLNSKSMQASQSVQSMHRSDEGTPTAPRSAAVSPAHDGTASSRPFGMRQLSNQSNPPPQAQVATNNTPPSTLRARQTRNSNSTPSMLIRHVHQQASDATAALKSPFTHPPDSPDEALRRLANNPSRRTLSHRKSAKSLKIGSPQLLSSSANLEHMPMIDASKRNGTSNNDTSSSSRSSRPASPEVSRKSASTSPEVSRKGSVAGLKFKMRFKSKQGDGQEDEYVPNSADSSNVSGGMSSPRTASAAGRNIPRESVDTSSSSGIKQLVARLRRRKVSNDIANKLIPDPLILHSPHWSSPKELQGPLSPADHAFQAHFNRNYGQGPPSISSHGTDTMADTSPLKVMDKSASSDKPSSLGITGNDPLSPTVGNLAVNSDNKDKDRASATSIDSMRKLFEAATALGLDAERVNELVDAAGYRQSINGQQPENQVVRSTVILAPTDKSYFPPFQTIDNGSHSSPAKATPSTTMTRSASSGSLGRSRSMKSVRNRNASVSSVAMSTNGGSYSRQEDVISRPAIEGGNVSDRRSVHDRPPTPPPDRKTHRRQKSDVLAAENPLPVSPEMPVVQLNSALPHHAQYASMARRRNISNESDDLSMPTPPFARIGKDSRASYVSSKTSGSYDARSIYGLYGDDEEEIPPTPGIKDMNMILASGRIPGSSNGSQRASIMLAPGVSAKRLSTASRNSRIELAEYANGDIAFNIVQSLRRPPGTGDGDRGTYYPMDLHRRQNSDNSVEEELNSLVASVNASPEADPLKLLIKRHLKEQNKSPTITPNAAMETIAHLQSLHPAGRQRSVSAATRASSARSVFEVYEAADENQVAALIEELTRGLDEGQFNLSRNDSIARATMKKPKSTAAVQSSPSSNTRQPINDPASIPRPVVASVQRTPSKIKRQPPPTI